MKMVHTPHPAKGGGVGVIFPKPGEAAGAPQGSNFTHPYTVFDFYAQSISLNQVNFFGLGNDTTLAGKSVFGMSQTIVGGSVIKLVYEWAAIRWLRNLSLLGESQMVLVDIRGVQMAELELIIYGPSQYRYEWARYRILSRDLFSGGEGFCTFKPSMGNSATQLRGKISEVAMRHQFSQFISSNQSCIF